MPTVGNVTDDNGCQGWYCLFRSCNYYFMVYTEQVIHVLMNPNDKNKSIEALTEGSIHTWCSLNLVLMYVLLFLESAMTSFVLEYSIVVRDLISIKPIVSGICTCFVSSGHPVMTVVSSAIRTGSCEVHVCNWTNLSGDNFIASKGFSQVL